MSDIVSSTVKTTLVSLARELGFDDCRVASCAPPPHREEFSDWLKQGAQGEMGYMARGEEKRRDPQLVLAGAKSVVVLALNYFQGTEQGKRPTSNAQRPTPNDREESGKHRTPNTEHRTSNDGSAATGRIARYAWGEDYHDVIAEKLEALDKFLSEAGGTQKSYVDTGPVLERDFAAQAGIGWHGKSTMLLNQELGTWFFLAEILTTLALLPDPPQRDRCGTCTRCIDACPTNAITAPHQLDARRCISYLTIELKTSIPIEFRPLMGDRIFGCDDCLDACPWNRFAKISQEARFAARPATVGMALRDYLSLNDDQFRAMFRNSPIKRIKRRGFLRNVCVALGNVGDSGDLAALERAASDPEPLIAEHAAWAINRIRERVEGHNSESNRSPRPVPPLPA